MILLQIKLTPSTTLTFQLERGAQPKTVTVVTASYCIDVLGPLIIFCCTQVLKVANATNSKVLFKVKTTQPTWYYVRPNQQILNAGQTEDVAILMVEAECK